MQTKWAKRIKDWVNFYKTSFSFPSPCKILLDGNFIHSCLKNNIDALEKVTKIFPDKIIGFVTKCIIQELEHIGSPVEEALQKANNFDCLECKHEGIFSSDDCILNFVGCLKRKSEF